MGKYGKEYWKSEEYRNSRKERARVIYLLIKDKVEKLEQPFLSIGCGPGILERELSRLLGKEIFGLEIDKDVLVSKDNVIIGDGRELPFKENTFEFILLNHVIEHIPHPHAVIKEIRRVLKPSGLVYVATPNLLWPYEVHYRLPFVHWLPGNLKDVMVKIFRRGEAFEDVYLLSYTRIKKLFENEGFKIYNLLPEMMFRKKEALRKKWWKIATSIVKYLPLIRNLITTHLSPQHTFLAIKEK